MKFTIHGFSQERALEFRKEIEKNGKKTIIKLDDTDLLLLRWFVDFFPRMSKLYIDRKEYAWVNYSTIVNDLPLLGVTKQSVYLRFSKLDKFGILEHKHIKDSGSYSYYGFGDNYGLLIDTDEYNNRNSVGGTEKITEGSIKNYQGGQYKIIEGVNKKLSNKDSSIIYNSSIKYNSNIYMTNSDKIENPSSDSFYSKNEHKKTSSENTEKDNRKNNSTKLKENQYIENFEMLWKMIPSHKNDRKSKVSKSRKKELYEMGTDRVKKAIDLYIKIQEPQYYHRRDNFFNEVIDNYIDKEESDFTKKNSGYYKVPDKYSVNKDYSGGWD